MIDKELRVGDVVYDNRYERQGGPYTISSISDGIVKYKNGMHDDLENIMKVYDLSPKNYVESFYLIHN